MDYIIPGFLVLHYLLEFAQILVHCLLTPLLLASVFPSIRVFSSEMALHIRWPKYWSFSFSISPSSEYSGLISFRIDWFDQSLQSQESSPALQFEGINSLALSLLYGPTLIFIHDYWKNHSFDFVGKVISLLFNMLSRFVIAFLPRSKCLLILWLQSPSAVILEPKKIKSVTASTFPPSIWSDWTRCHDLSVLNIEFQASFLTLLFHPYQEAH